MSFSRFTELLHTREDEIAQDAFQPIFDSCPRIETLWLEHETWYAIAPSLDGLDRLTDLRELSLSFTRLHFVPVRAVDRLHTDTLRTSPSLTHVGFGGESAGPCVQRAAARNDGLGVLVRGEARRAPLFVHPRVLYLRSLALSDDHDWLKRACPEWNPELPRVGGDGPFWDQWTFFDAVLAARGRGKLLATGEPMTNRVKDQPDLL
ncbi:hypothetical protein C8R45DRAFT_1128022 [Mycena sanguinolenta]|nr:hypothetical protein C8R45DRAFT_1128022 [Mycena sanguinolenta]